MNMGFEDNRPTVLAPSAAIDHIVLRVENGLDAGRQITVETLPCRLGRAGRSDIILADPDDPPGVSREHATLEICKGILVIRDHSVNGTRAGDRWLRRDEAAEWVPGQLLQLGPTVQISRIDSMNATRTGVEITARQDAPVPMVKPGTVRSFLTSSDTLASAWRREELNRGAAGPDNITVAEFARNALRRLDSLRSELARGRYTPLPPRIFAAPKRNGGVRRIAIFSVSDRIVQQAIHMALQPILEPKLPACSYAYRPGVCAHHALRHIDGLLQQGLHWVAETDIAAFFDNISHQILLDKLASEVPDPFALSLISNCLAIGATEVGIGLAQGGAMSPLLSNLYLAEFDAHMLDGEWNPVRYGDDLVFLGSTRASAQAALADAEGFLRSRLRLTLQAEKTGIAPLAKGFTFLGYRFTDEGRRPAPQAISRLEERLEECAPTQSASVIRGWKNYYGEGAVNAGPAIRSGLDDEVMNRFLHLFGGREDVHAKQGSGRFAPCGGPLTAERICAHLAGTETLATYFQRLDGQVQMIALDIDAIATKEVKVDTDPAIAFAEDLRRTCRMFGIPASLEDSGRRGRHLWVFFSSPIAPDRARRLVRLLALHAGFPRDGVRLEIFPRHSEWPGPELGDAVKLPFGVHPATGRRCHFLDATGEPIVKVEEALSQIKVLQVNEIENIVARLNSAIKVPSEPQNPQRRRIEAQADPLTDDIDAPIDAVGSLVAGCSVVRALAERARTTGHLRHTHNLILLYTAGRLGSQGAAFVHRTVSQCRNYDARVCQGYLDRLDLKHPPLSCRKIREWLEEEGETGLCTCDHGRRTPLEHDRTTLTVVPVGARKPAARSRPPAKPLPSDLDSDMRDAWKGIAKDLFASDVNTETGSKEALEELRLLCMFESKAPVFAEQGKGLLSLRGRRRSRAHDCVTWSAWFSLEMSI